jgi:hypothetical protein
MVILTSRLEEYIQEESVDANPAVTPTKSQKWFTTFCVAVHRNGGMDEDSV